MITYKKKNVSLYFNITLHNGTYCMSHAQNDAPDVTYDLSIPRIVMYRVSFIELGYTKNETKLT